MTKQITTEEVKKLVDGGASDYTLVDVLSDKSFEGMHIAHLAQCRICARICRGVRKSVARSEICEDHRLLCKLRLSVKPSCRG